MGLIIHKAGSWWARTKKRALFFLLRKTGGKKMGWGEACSYCKGYPLPEPQYCRCSTRVRFRRWLRKEATKRS